MGEISVDKITITLDRHEAIDVGHAILHRLEKTAAGGYKVESNHPGMLTLCKQLLNTAYGYDFSDEVDRRLKEADTEVTTAVNSTAQTPEEA